MKNRTLVLASSSPRRRELLEYAGLQFVVDAPGIEENMNRKLTPRKLVETLALEKVVSVAVQHKDAIVLAADTIVAIARYKWSAPKNEREARFILKTLSGKTHDVWTGFAILDTRSGKQSVNAVRTRVTILSLSKKDIDRQVNSTEGLSGAGGYMIQKSGAALIKKIEGDYTNIVGLPLPAVRAELKRFGVRM